jgi:hypothetical protein
MHRTIRVVVASLLAFCALGAVAYALDQTNGQGKTHLGGTLGFNAKQDLSGSIEFQDSTNTYSIHCDGLSKYRDSILASGAFKSIVNSTTCYGQATDANPGAQYYLHIEFIDKGEPGTYDKVCLSLSLYPASQNDVLVFDCGVIQNGNVQIHGADNNPDSLSTADASVDETDIFATQ